MAFQENDPQFEFGAQLGAILKVLPESLHDFFCDYFRLEIHGWEHLPLNGRGIVVANHSDALGFDAFMLGYSLRKTLSRKPRIMAHSFWFDSPLKSGLMRHFGFFPADLREGLQVLRDDNMLVIFPEGADGNFKVSSSMYKLVDFNPGFVPLAIMEKAPVIPAVIIGAEETHYNLAKIDLFKDIIGASVPFVLNPIPFPAKWKIIFLPPIDFSKYSKKDIKDARFVKEINQNIRYRIQHEINREIKDRDLIIT
ncbi:MAG: 1-acyl-sn-glycerol-3-phosphate acyltransferase [Leptospiraceae bacterium]|nr:1-acyl-sn-glycerol-3-phosphate acyltransferase [Leptospiraceae bacterium]MCB1201033.1 1-acyl-sn-glycerol-3-phosphate acyltransferase [Leptospiraceae bacterium]